MLQTQIGHRLFEENGRDNTKINLAEAKRTYNIVPLLLIFFYHFVVDVYLRLGFRPDLLARIESHRRREEQQERFRAAHW